jgi:hypothetical protein
MKKILFVFICSALFVGESMAQYANTTPNTANLLKRMEQNAPHLYSRYRSASVLNGVGAGLTLGGIGVMILGIATGEKNTTTTDYGARVEVTGTGGAIAGVGLISALVGTPIWITGGIKKKNLRRAYIREFENVQTESAPPSAYLKLNSSPQGIGLALVF